MGVYTYFLHLFAHSIKAVVKWHKKENNGTLFSLTYHYEH